MSFSPADLASQYCVLPDRVILTNAIEVAATGEPHLVLNRHILESGLFRPMGSFGGVFQYPTVLERAAVMLESLCQNHAFQQGNKRTAWTTTTTYLALHRFELIKVPDAQAAAFVEGIVLHRYTVPAIVAWLADRLA